MVFLLEQADNKIIRANAAQDNG